MMSLQFSVADGQMVEIRVSEELEIPVSDVQMVMVTHPPKSQELHEQFSISENAAKSNCQTMQVDTELGFHEPMQFLKPNYGLGEAGAYSCASIPSLPAKRKAKMEPLNTRSGSLQRPVPNKRVSQVLGTSTPGGLLQPLGTNKKGAQMQSTLSSPTTQNQTANKKMGRNDSSKSKSHRVQTPKGGTIPIISNSKFSRESSEAVRSKMRESLAAALELACPNHERSAEETNSTDQISGMSQPPHSDTSVSCVASDNFENIQNYSSGETADKPSGAQGSSTFLPSGDDAEEPDCFKDFQLANEDVSYTDDFKDELLQGHGLTWAWEMDMDSSGMSEVLNDANSVVAHEDVDGDELEEVRKSPLDLAHEIEGELFKLYGGVNKKYKEKGRSLLFNLRDPSNPELRERVISGVISPGRLCSMTAEELASKELSEWRMAKAEELAQMVVLPDTDVNMRRFVKKTHKGEYQVEREDDISVEVKDEERFTRIPKVEDTNTVPNSGQENHDISGRLIIPNDGTDLMQGMIVDEMKDADFLPPIVSLDEFMESLDSEPPFKDLPVDAGHTMNPLEKRNEEAGDKVVSADVLPNVSTGNMSKKTEKEVKRHKQMDQRTAEQSKQSAVVSKIVTSESIPAVHLWQGSLQLSISSSVRVLGTFKRGEKTSTKEWPTSLEVKGRVRLDPFKKFIKNLPMSRSRALMVVHFSLKDSTSEDEKAKLSEAVESYVSDERLGFAEPTSEVELYLCPPKSTIADMLFEHVSKDVSEILNSTENGLIGIVVWRKVHSSSSKISPKSSSHHKDALKTQHSSARRHHEKDVNVSRNSMAKGPLPQLSPKPPSKEDVDDDIPPGFGPGMTKDDDDLPEFNFPGSVNPYENRFPSHIPSMGPTPSVVNPLRQPQLNRSAEQLRQLVQKYGQTTATPSKDSGSVALALEPWEEDDDDDDIPEWRPQLPNHNHPQQVHSTLPQQYLQRNAAVPNSPMPLQFQGGGRNIAPSWQRGHRYAQPGFPENINIQNLVVPGQQQYRLPVQGTHTLDRRHGIPRSRAL